MAPHVWGPSQFCTCDRCGQSWRIVAETYSQTIPLNCPNCQLPCEAGPINPGDLVVAQAVDSDATVRRLQCVIFGSSRFDSESKKPLDSNPWNCKRVWGLPGEEIDLKNGELVIDGKHYQKSMAELLEVAIPVCSLPEDRFSYWQFYPRTTEGEKRIENSTRESMKPPEHASKDNRTIPLMWREGDRVVWCYNQNEPRILGATNDLSTLTSTIEAVGRERCQSVFDDYVFDHSTPRRLSAVDDLLTIIDLEDSQTTTDAVLEIRSTYKREQFSFELDLKPKEHQPRQIAFAVFDHQIQVSVGFSDGQFELYKMQGGRPVESPVTTMELVVKRGQIGAQSLHVLRDLYLQQNERDPANFDSSPVLLGSNEFFVMGDNLPISQDSRNGLGLVPRQAIQAVLPLRSEHYIK